MKAPARERVVLASAHAGTAEEDARALDELAELVRSAGAEPVGRMSQRRGPGGGPHLFGKGKVGELAEACRAARAQAVVVRQTLSPGELRRLEDALPCRVVDRTALILDVFAQRARSREGQLQVELAQLLYRLPRLRGKGVELSRLGGGIGTRGPGEQKLEYDRRRIGARISRLKAEIASLRDRRSRQRQRRRERALPVIVLAGYTNAGKSTLFNALARAGAVARDQMFSTLDPQVRQLRLPGGRRVLLVDTVGFISDLPADLRVAFRATLEELTAADAILHVVDAAHPDAAAHRDAVLAELRELGAENVPRLTVLNKADRVPLAALGNGDGAAGTVRTSALTGEGLAVLLERLEGWLAPAGAPAAAGATA